MCVGGCDPTWKPWEFTENEYEILHDIVNEWCGDYFGYYDFEDLREIKKKIHMALKKRLPERGAQP